MIANIQIQNSAKKALININAYAVFLNKHFLNPIAYNNFLHFSAPLVIYNNSEKSEFNENWFIMLKNSRGKATMDIIKWWEDNEA